MRDFDPKGFLADRVDRELRDEMRNDDGVMRTLLADVDPLVLANSVRALLKERDQRSPHYLLAFALRAALDVRVNEEFIPRYERDRRVA